jgi:hypothetical protein
MSEIEEELARMWGERRVREQTSKRKMQWCEGRVKRKQASNRWTALVFCSVAIDCYEPLGSKPYGGSSLACAASKYDGFDFNELLERGSLFTT